MDSSLVNIGDDQMNFAMSGLKLGDNEPLVEPEPQLSTTERVSIITGPLATKYRERFGFVQRFDNFLRLRFNFSG